MQGGHRGSKETFQTCPHENGEKKFLEGNTVTKIDFQDHSIYVPRGIKDKLFGKEISLLTPKEAGIRMAFDKIDPASFVMALGNNPVLFARSQSALGFIEGYEHSLTAYDGVIGDMSQWWEKRACRGISPTTLEVFGTCPFKFLWERYSNWSHWKSPKRLM